MEGLVLTDGDRLGHHLGRQEAALAGTVVEDRLLELGDGLLGAKGTGDEMVQASPPKELANQAEAACPLLGEGQMTGTDQPMQERQARRALEERDQGRIGIEGLFPLQPVLECRTGDTHLLGKGRWLEGLASNWRINSAT